jgi:hypothetical protein
MCSSILDVLDSKTDDEIKGYADRLNSFVTQHLTYENVQIHARHHLEQRALQTPSMDGSTVVGDVLTLPDGSKLTKVTCAELKRSHKARIPDVQHWQIDAWLDDECRIINSYSLGSNPV